MGFAQGTGLMHKVRFCGMIALVERIDERGISEMLAIENYSVQATRREADQQRAEAERRLKSTIKALFDMGRTVAEIASIMNVTEEDVIFLLPELSPA